MPCLIRDCDQYSWLSFSLRHFVGIDALFDKGRRKEGSWEALKLGRWEKEEGLEAGNMTIE